MDINAYLERIKYYSQRNVNTETLFQLHERHAFSVPFENVDIQFKKRFDLKPQNIFNKVVLNKRGGFCYELNGLFCELLLELGFESRILEAKVYTSEGNPGPAFDHMCILVRADKDYLADVGFGDFFLRPLEIKSGVQFDGRNYFRIDPLDDNSFNVSMSSDGLTFEKKYAFSMQHISRSDFEPACLEKQTSPDSHFVKNLICTKPTVSGRISIVNDKFIERKNNERNELKIEDTAHLKDILQSRFDIQIN